MSDNDRRRQILAAIDAANAKDPHRLDIDGRRVAAELVYSERMSQTLARLVPDASEPLMIAARGQHIERWTSPRAAYPEGRVGYLRWRTDLKAFHARRLGEIMRAHCYDEPAIDRVGSLVRKERLKNDPEAQALEDVVCVVFLNHYLADFAANHDDEKLAGILAKTWRKMSPRGHEAASKLGLPTRILALLEAGLARLSAAAHPETAEG